MRNAEGRARRPCRAAVAARRRSHGRANGRPGADCVASQLAFTLIELLVTVVILSTGIVVILQAFQTSMVALAASRDSMRSAALRHALMVKADWNALGASGGGIEQVLRERYPDYRWHVDPPTDAPLACTNSNWLRREVRVSVWHQVTGREAEAETLLRVRNPASVGMGQGE